MSAVHVEAQSYRTIVSYFTIFKDTNSIVILTEDLWKTIMQTGTVESSLYLSQPIFFV